jgi:hypothetical protein
MAVYGGPEITTNGLVLYLDAANSKSYPGTGTTWTDLSSLSNNGTLTNGPIYSSANNGSIVFDGTNDYVDCGNNSSLNINTGSILAWVKTTSPGSSYRGIIVKQSNYGLFALDGTLVTYDWGNNLGRSTARRIDNGIWNFIAMSFSNNIGTPSNNAIIYLNGASVLTTTIKYLNNNQSIEIGRGSVNIQQINANISNVMVYNIVLSANEILQNYNAFKGRYGL